MAEKKTHAKDYLLEYANGKQDWLRSLIQEAIDTNGSIPDNRLDEIFESLKNDSHISSQTNQTISQTVTNDKILFKTLKHISGVNALSEKQTIKFSPNVTVLYGLNGSGKSGYFRILNEICGGNQKKEILPNIYVDEAQKKDISVQLEYSKGTKTNTLNWDNTSRALPAFHGVKVFDSSYLNGLLESRTPDETIVYPLGLHLFAYVATIMDNYSTRLNNLVAEENGRLPTINVENLSEKLKILFASKQNIPDNIRTEIKGLYSFSEEDNKNLTDKQTELANLQQVNYEDKIKLLSQNRTDCVNFKDKINNAVTQIKRYSEELKQAFENFETAKEKNDKALRQSQILKDIPKSDTPEWKSFIKAGQDYFAKLEEKELKVCPYCHQEIKTPEVTRLIQAYADFLNDTSEKELKTANFKLNEIRKNIERLAVDIPITEEIKSIFADLPALESKILSIASYKERTLLLAKQTEDITVFSIDISNELKVVDEAIINIEKEYNRISTSKEEKEKSISVLQKDIAVLKEKKSISEQKKVIEQYFSIHDNAAAIEKKRSQLSTRNLTIAANTAQNELLTLSLESKLRKELEKLDRKDLKVQLIVSKGNKGNCRTELTLQGNNPIKNILSEGEQKAVGLAVFFAEIQDDNYPIILDDPVTSLDHEIAGYVAKRLIDFDNQIIVFCHNRLFLDGFETSRNNHICKNTYSCCNTKGKHIVIYNIYSSELEKGIITNYKGDNSDSLLKDAKIKLNQTPFSDNYSVCILLRRAVEKIIDEEVFKYQLPPRVSNKNSRIGWDELKMINPKPEMIERLQKVHNDVSEDEHDGTASIENPLSLSKLKELENELESIKSEFANNINS